MSMNMAATLWLGRVSQDLGQLADQDAAIARVFAWDPDPRQGARISATAEGNHVPGSTPS
jgi:hypothetical protein